MRSPWSFALLAVLYFSPNLQAGCARILVVGDGNFLAHTSRPLEVAKVLRARGHEITFAVAGTYADTVVEQQFKTLAIRQSECEKISQISRDGYCNWWTPAELRENIAEDRALIAQTKPDIVLTDFHYSMVTAAEADQVPHALILNALWSNYFSGKLTAPDGFFLTKYIGKTGTNLIVPILKYFILKHGVRAHNVVRREMGLPTAHNLFNLFERATLGLFADIPSYGPMSRVPENQTFVGPLVWEPSYELDSRVEEWSATQPKAYVTMGSTGQLKYLQMAVGALEEMGVQCLVSTGKLGDIVTTRSSTIVKTMLPGLEAAKAVDFVVCQGGNGTVYQALRAGKPIVGIPVLHDQQFNMDSVVNLKMGISLRERNLTPAVIQHAAQAVLKNRAATDKQALSFQPEFSQYLGPETAADAIENFLKTRRP